MQRELSRILSSCVALAARVVPRCELTGSPAAAPVLQRASQAAHGARAEAAASGRGRLWKPSAEDGTHGGPEAAAPLVRQRPGEGRLAVQARLEVGIADSCATLAQLNNEIDAQDL